jgi:hypothetical protein
VDHALPQDGDVIVHRQVHSPAVYILSRLDAPLQVSYRTHGEALKAARAFTAQSHLDAWYTTDEQTFTRVAQHRL